MPRQKRWFVESLGDSHTNHVFSKVLEEESAGARKAEHGKTVNVWECTLEERDGFIRSTRDLNLKFRIYCDKQDGVLKRWYPPNPRERNLRLVSDTPRPRRGTLYVATRK